MGKYHWIYADARFISARISVMERDKGLCQACKRRGKIKAGTECHHIIWLTAKNCTDEAIAFGIDNLEMLCVDCHNEVHSRSIGLMKFVQPVPIQSSAATQHSGRDPPGGSFEFKAKRETVNGRYNITRESRPWGV